MAVARVTDPTYGGDEPIFDYFEVVKQIESAIGGSMA